MVVDNSDTIVCWNCSERTLPGTCSNCGVELQTPIAMKKEEEPKRKHIIEIRKHGQKIQQLDLDELAVIVKRNFKVKRSILLATPRFLIEDPGLELEASFETLIVESNEFLDGLTPKIERISRNSTDYVIHYAYVEPLKEIEIRRGILFAVFTYFSIFFAGIFNFTQMDFAQKNPPDSPNLSEIIFSLSSITFAFGFSLVVIILLSLKDAINLYLGRKKSNLSLYPYYVPAPPIFELGTLGSFLSQRKIHSNRRSLFHSAFWGPLIAWLFATSLIITTLNFGDFDPDSAVQYSQNHSIVVNDNFEPIGLKYFVILSNLIGITDIDTSTPISEQYLLHPITLGALVAFYLIGLSLLPASHFNGGYLIRAKLGKRFHTLFTYLTITLFLTIHWFFSLLLLFIHQRLGTPEVLNEESNLHAGSTFQFLIYLGVLILTIPLPLTVLY